MAIFTARDPRVTIYDHGSGMVTGSVTTDGERVFELSASSVFWHDVVGQHASHLALLEVDEFMPFGLEAERGAVFVDLVHIEDEDDDLEW